MVFNDTTNKNGIIQKVEDLINIGDGGITGNATLLLKVTGYVNEAYRKVASALMRVDKRWQFDDWNYTDLPRGSANLVANQGDYTLPAATSGGNASTLLGVVKIAVLDTNSTPQEHILELTDLPESELNNMYQSTSPGLPCVYKLVSNTIKMWPVPSSTFCTMTNGLVVYFKRVPSPFSSSTNSVEPGFMQTYHDILAYDAAATYLVPKNPAMASNYLSIVQARMEMMQDDYAHLNEDSETKIITKYFNPR